MTVFDLNEKRGAWFELEGGGRVQLRTLDADDFRAIKKKTYKTRVEYRKVDGTPARFVAEDFDEDLQNELFWDAVIMDWEKFFDAAGEAIPCTKENKIILLTRSGKFMRFISESLDALKNDEEAEAEAAEKN